MKYAIIKLGGSTGKELLPQINQCEDLNIVGFTDKNMHIIGSAINGYPVISTFDALELYRENSDGVNYIFIFSYKIGLHLLSRMVHELISLGVNRKDLFVVTPQFMENPQLENLCNWDNYYCIPYLEFHVVDHCNMNCKGCVHFSPLVNGHVFAEYEQVENDLVRLHEIVPYIDRIHILGGEPLLNPDLDNYVKLVKKIYPYSELKIVTNGLLISKMSQQLIETLRKYKTGLSISFYPPLKNKMGSIIKFLNENNIEYNYGDPIEEFAYTFTKSKGMAKEVSYQSCTCPNLYRGKLYICPIVAYIKYFNEAFQTSIDENEGAINIYDDGITFSILKDKLRQTIQLCDQCLYISKEKAHLFPWEHSKKSVMDDYIYHGERI